MRWLMPWYCCRQRLRPLPPPPSPTGCAPCGQRCLIACPGTPAAVRPQPRVQRPAAEAEPARTRHNTAPEEEARMVRSTARAAGGRTGRNTDQGVEGRTGRSPHTSPRAAAEDPTTAAALAGSAQAASPTRAHSTHRPDGPLHPRVSQSGRPPRQALGETCAARHGKQASPSAAAWLLGPAPVPALKVPCLDRGASGRQAAAPCPAQAGAAIAARPTPGRTQARTRTGGSRGTEAAMSPAAAAADPVAAGRGMPLRQMPGASYGSGTRGARG